MSGFLRFVGSALLLFFIATAFFGEDIKHFFPDDYRSVSDYLINHKWYLLALSIILSTAGSITKVAKAIKKKRQKPSIKYLNETSDEEDASRLKEEREIYAAYGLSSPSPSSSTSSSTSYSASLRTSSLATSASSSPIERMKSRFKQFVHEQQKLVNEQYQLTAKEFADQQQGKLRDVALKTDWAPLCGGGSNFKTSELKYINSSRLEVHKSKGGFLFSGLFAVLGLAVMIFGTYFIIVDHGLNFAILAPILFGGVFAAVGIGLIIYPRPRIFDRRYGWFWSGDKSLAREQDFITLKNSARLSDIAAIQIITERVSGNKGGSYRSWEINIVSDDGQRLNVMDHGNKDAIDADAQKLADFLAVPVWENS